MTTFDDAVATALAEHAAALAALDAAHAQESTDAAMIATLTGQVSDLMGRLTAALATIAAREHADQVAALRSRRESLSWEAGDRATDDGVCGVLDPAPVGGWTDLEQDDAGDVWLDAGRTYENVRIWGRPRARGEGTVLDNVQMHGPDPARTLPKNSSCYVNFSDPIIEVRNGLIDPSAWVSDRGRPGQVEAFGVHGGRLRGRWIEIRNVQDGLNLTHGDLDLQWVNVIDGLYRNTGENLQAGGRTHPDGVQIGRNSPGAGYSIRCFNIGGARDGAAYLAVPGSRGDGHDFGNSGVMLKRETTDGVPILALIEHGTIGGGSASINAAIKSGVGDALAGVTIRDVEILERGSDWNPPATNATNRGYGWYIVAAKGVAWTLDNVCIAGTATPAPVTIATT